MVSNHVSNPKLEIGWQRCEQTLADLVYCECRNDNQSLKNPNRNKYVYVIFFVLLTHSLAKSAIGPNDPSVGKNAAILYEGLTGPTIGIVTPPGKIGSRNNDMLWVCEM